LHLGWLCRQATNLGSMVKSQMVLKPRIIYKEISLEDQIRV